MCATWFWIVWFDQEKWDLLLGFEYDYHCPDKLNYSISHPNTRSTRACIKMLFKHDENVVSHIMSVRNHSGTLSNCLIHRRKSVRRCKTNIGHSCKAKVEKSKHGTHAPTYQGLKKEIVSTTTSLQFFCFVEMTLIVASRVARRNGCLIGQISQLFARWRLEQMYTRCGVCIGGCMISTTTMCATVITSSFVDNAKHSDMLVTFLCSN